MESLWVQLLLQLYTKHFETFQVFYHSLKVCMMFGYNPHVIFFCFFRSVFSTSVLSEYTTCMCKFLSFSPIIITFCKLILHALKMCICFWGYLPFIFYQLFPDFFFLSGLIVPGRYLKRVLKCL